MRIEIVYALARAQKIAVLQLAAGACVGDAVAASGFETGSARFGIGGREVNAAELLRDGDRVEILRPLALDPKEARRLRARSRSRRRGR